MTVRHMDGLCTIQTTTGNQYGINPTQTVGEKSICKNKGCPIVIVRCAFNRYRIDRGFSNARSREPRHSWPVANPCGITANSNPLGVRGGGTIQDEKLVPA